MKLLGSLAQACPNCDVALAKMPARKTRCKDCGLFLYVRTRPQDGVQVLLTEQDAQALQSQWHQYEDDKAQIGPRSETSMSQARNALREQFGRAPSESDVLWRVFTDELLTYSSSESWSLYTHVLFEMAELEVTQGNERGALDHYIQAVHPALNGPRNIDRELVRAGYPRFSPPGFGVEMYIRRMVKAQKKFGLSRKQLEAQYLLTANRASAELVLPLTADTSWKSLMTSIAHDA